MDGRDGIVQVGDEHTPTETKQFVQHTEDAEKAAGAARVCFGRDEEWPSRD